MSLDVTLTNADGAEVYSANITHNLNRMAMEAGIYECLWRPDEHGITKAAQIIAQNLTDIGLKVETDSVDPAAYFNRLFDPADKFHDLMIWERNGYYPDADDMIPFAASAAMTPRPAIWAIEPIDCTAPCSSPWLRASTALLLNAAIEGWINPCNAPTQIAR